MMGGRALLIIHDKASRDRAANWAQKLPEGTRVEFKGPARSLPQNSRMWASLTDVATQVEWYGAKLSPEDWKDVFTASLRRARVVPGLDPGTYVPLGMRTSDMSKEEMANLLELIGAFGAEHNVTFHDPDLARRESLGEAA
jgi:hypothetical protein